MVRGKGERKGEETKYNYVSVCIRGGQQEMVQGGDCRDDENNWIPHGAPPKTTVSKASLAMYPTYIFHSIHSHTKVPPFTHRHTTQIGTHTCGSAEKITRTQSRTQPCMLARTQALTRRGREKTDSRMRGPCTAPGRSPGAPLGPPRQTASGSAVSTIPAAHMRVPPGQVVV